MSKDPLGGDPLGITPIVHIQEVRNPKLQRALQAYANNVLVKGTTVAGTITPGTPIGEDGLPLTPERRKEIAAARATYDPKKAMKGELDYAHDAPPIETEKLGVSAQKEIDKQPDITIVIPKELVIRPLTPEEKLELGVDDKP